MSVNWLTLRDLEYLVTVAQTLHFGRAAEKCRVSQPALSVQIRKMEELLGVTLFERTNRSVALSDIGARIAEQAKSILDEAMKLEAIAQGSRGVLKKSIRLGAIATLGPYYIPFILGPLKKAYPEAKLLIREGLTHELLHELKNGTLDAVLASPPFVVEGLARFDLFVEPFLLATPKGHPLQKKEPLKPSDVKAAEMVLLEDGHCLKDQALELCSLGRKGSPQEFQATSMETLKHLVAEGLGYTLIPALAARPDPRLDALISYRSFHAEKVGRMISLVCREKYAEMADLKALAEFLKKKVPERCKSA